MRPYSASCYSLILFGFLILFAASSLAGASAPVPTRYNNDATTRKGFDYFNNLEYDKAIKEFQSALKAHPDDPYAVNHLLAGIIFQELYRIGALDTEAYASDSFVSRKNLQPLDPKVQDQVKQLSDQALALEQAQLDQNPDSTDALYARGVTRGLRATYMGMAQHAWISALRTAVAARHDEERVLELDPNFVDAKDLVGVHLYVIGSLSFPVKMAAAMTGITGSKQKGLDYLREVAAHGTPDVASDAKLALALFLRREQKYAEAIQVVGQLQQEYPKNFLVAAEYAHLLNAAGHGQAAIAAYRKVVDGCKASTYAVCQIAIPAYGLGEALRGQREYEQAAEAYDLAAGTSPDPEFRQRAMLAAGQMYDVLKKRDEALAKYRAVVAQNSGSGQAEMARQYMKQAYKTN
jgi:tetratricopeptide (TPR) repeat protein